MSALEYWSDGLMKDTQTITPLRQYSITLLPNRRWRAIQYRSKLVQMSWSLPIFRVAGIQLRIHITFLLLIAWLAFGYYAQGGSAVAASRVIFVLLLFLCVVLHEFGHAFAAKAFGINTPDITLLPIGGVARLERMPEEPVQELIIAVAGPLVNVVIALGLFVAGGFQALLNPSNIEGGDLVAQLLTINIMLVLFNLLPAFPMDGGRVLRALLATRLSYARATQVAANVGQGFAFVFGFIGLLWNPFLLFIALFVYIGASQEAALAQMKDVSRRFPVSSAMVREFRTLSADASLQEAVDALLATSQHDFPVVDDGGNVAGLLTRQDLIGALRKNDPSLRVGDVMRRDIPTVTTGTRFEDAFRIMQECNCPAVPVLDRMKRLVGLLTPENVTELMMVQSAMPQRRVL
jgi:Zn-dependent protease/CBS domain-containing protein